ncbi:MAG: flagellar biosynthetic protein FliO, partial [Gaiellales bacterium]
AEPAVVPATPVAKPQPGSVAAAKAKAQAKDQDAAERRAAESSFEREKLDQGAFAKADAEAKNPDKKSGGDSGSILRMIFGLIVVIGSIFGIHMLLKKWGSSRMQGVAGRSGVIDVVATTSLAQGRALHLVRIGDELVLVGATEQSITRIGDFDPGVLGATAANSGNGEFQAMLAGSMLGNQPGVPTGMGGAGSSNEPFLKRFMDNLRMTTAR